MEGFQSRIGTAREVFSELRRDLAELIQRDQGITQQGMNIKRVARPVERPESFDIVRIEFKELVDKALRNLGDGQVHLVEGSKQSQQVEPGRLQA